MLHELPPDMLSPAHYFYSEIKPGVSVMFAVPPDTVKDVLNDPQYIEDLQEELDDLTRYMRRYSLWLKIRHRFEDMRFYCVQLQAEINLARQIVERENPHEKYK